MRMVFFTCGGLLASMALAGCADHSPPIQAIDVHAISAVQAEIKSQVGLYMAAARAEPRVNVNGKMVRLSTVPLTVIDDEHRAFMCGTGLIKFDISSIKVELTTTMDTTSDLKFGLTIPVDVVTLGPSGEAKRENIDTETLDYNLWPMPESKQNRDIYDQKIDDDVVGKAQIARALRDLREALVGGAMKYDLSGPTPQKRNPSPCFTDYNPEKPAADAGDTFKFGLSITNDLQGGISIKVAILNFGATGEAKSTTGNTLTVSFVQSDIANIQALKDVADTECKHPNEEALKCKVAKAALAKAEGNDVGVGVEALPASKI